MKNIEIDEALYQYIASNTQFIGESASSILRRLLALSTVDSSVAEPSATVEITEELPIDAPVEKEVQLKGKKQVVDAKENATVQRSTAQSSAIQSNETVFNFINKEELAMQRGAVGRFLLILAALYRAHPDSFSVVNEISGRDRLYFAKSEAELDASGSSTKPRQIPDSPFWVITNSNTTRKKMMLTKASISLGYSEADVEKIRELL